MPQPISQPVGTPTSASVVRMSLVMTVEERQAFLAQVHIAVLAVAGDDGRAPLAVPVWYDYRPGGEVAMITERDSRKTTLVRRAGRITLCVQGTVLPYRYASAEGPVTAIEDTVTVEQRRALASRYLGPEGADAYLESTPGATERMVRILMRPEHWLTRDYTKLST
jgi:PPOX class probable F420-dependent enzyme